MVTRLLERHPECESPSRRLALLGARTQAQLYEENVSLYDRGFGVYRRGLRVEIPG